MRFMKKTTVDSQTAEVSSKKLSDKVFLQSLTVSLLGILVCIIALSSSTWAWFTKDLSSSQNSIQTGTCSVTVSIVEKGTFSVETSSESLQPVDGVYTFAPNTAYSVTMTAEGTVRSAFCKFVVETPQGEEAYYTEQIPTAAPENQISFTLLFDTETSAKLVECWGVAAREERELINGETHLNFEVQALTTGE